MNPDLDRLQPYPFERLARLTADVTPPTDRAAIRLSIGEPQDAPPALAIHALQEDPTALGHYPATRGSDALRTTIAAWLQQRYKLETVSADKQILPVNGTREALFAFGQTVVDRQQPRAAVLMPNPCYQIYEGAALLAGAEPMYYRAGTLKAPDFTDIDDADWDRCQLIYICNPGNPTGAVLESDALQALIERAHRHDFLIASDECYAEIHPDEARPPVGLLQAAADAGYPGFDRCIVFHSLSKRSNLPGLRSGFVAGDENVIAAFARYRTYHGCAMSPAVQAASIAVWQDETHVVENRSRYRERMNAVCEILADAMPAEPAPGSFYLWPRTPGDDRDFARHLLAAENVHVLPGSYLGRTVNGHNPGAGHIRMALVAETDTCIEAAQRIQRFMCNHFPNRNNPNPQGVRP